LKQHIQSKSTERPAIKQKNRAMAYMLLCMQATPATASKHSWTPTVTYDMTPLVTRQKQQGQLQEPFPVGWHTLTGCHPALNSDPSALPFDML
jgi:hypothetical protein